MGSIASARAIDDAPATMNDPKFQQHGGANSAEQPPHGPDLKRMQRSKFFWVAALFILVAMAIYVMTDSLSILPGGKSRPPVPALVP